jgi:hypothetical protein
MSICCYVVVVAYSVPYCSLSNIHLSSYCDLDTGQSAAKCVSVLFWGGHDAATRRQVISENGAPCCLFYFTTLCVH